MKSYFIIRWSIWAGKLGFSSASSKRLYRVCKAGAKVQINAPHPRHDHFMGDPTQVRVITPPLLAMFSKKENERWKKMGSANTPLAIYLNVDFEIRGGHQVIRTRRRHIRSAAHAIHAIHAMSMSMSMYTQPVSATIDHLLIRTISQLWPSVAGQINTACLGKRPFDLKPHPQES